MKKKNLKTLSLKKRTISGLKIHCSVDPQNINGGSLSLCITLFSLVISCQPPSENNCGNGTIPMWSAENCD